jgi:hypothetical protein
MAELERYRSFLWSTALETSGGLRHTPALTSAAPAAAVSILYACETPYGRS